MTTSFYCLGTFPSSQMRVISRWSSSRMGRSCSSTSFGSSMGRPSHPTAFTFAIAFIAVAASPSLGSVLRALATGCYGSLSEVSGFSMSDFAFSSERNNHTYLSWMRPLSRNSLSSSPRAYCDLTCFVPSSCTNFVFWKNPCWPHMCNCLSNSTPCISKK